MKQNKITLDNMPPEKELVLITIYDGEYLLRGWYRSPDLQAIYWFDENGVLDDHDLNSVIPNDWQYWSKIEFNT
ncbi:MAG: hypothetical protein GY928_24765 [Colwellia sp.]|nr:hypothetical protein [Colwellia sp.]